MNRPQSPPPSESFQESHNPHGRTVWDALAGTFQSKLLFYTFIGLLFSLIVYFLWDLISIVPLYALSSVVLSLFWYNPISSWLSRQSTFIEVWNPDNNTLTTYRAGRDAFSNLQRDGITNQVSSLTGNNRIFASSLDLESQTLEKALMSLGKHFPPNPLLPSGPGTCVIKGPNISNLSNAMDFTLS